MEHFTVSRDGFEFNLALCSMEDLHIHEEAIPELVAKLSRDIVAMNVLRNPIIVEGKHGVVLDGTHRFQALRSLGCLRVPTCKLDYSSDDVLVARWFRVFKSGQFKLKVMRILSGLRLNFSEGEVQEVLDGLGAEGSACGLLWPGEGRLVLHEDGGLDKKLEVMKKVEYGLQDLKCKVGYELEDEAIDKLARGLVDGVLALPPIGKRDVIECALKGYIFPRKTTRHIVPARPWNVNVPLHLMKSREITLNEANDLFIDLLRKKQIKVIPPGSMLNGRRYQEEVYEFLGS